MAEIDRRTVIAGGGAALAGAMLPAWARAAAPVEPSVFALEVGDVRGLGAPIRAPRPFALVGAQWSAPGRPSLELRFRLGDGGWSRWGHAGTLGHGPDSPSGARRTGEPLWAARADEVQLRSDGPVLGVRLHFVGGGAMAREPGATAAALALARPTLDAGPGQPAIIARESWIGGLRPHGKPAYGEVQLAFVHHTENPNGYRAQDVPALLRAIFLFHRDVNGWQDIGYNFVVDRLGRIWEAREGGVQEAVVGAQAGGYNTFSTGVAVLGDFSATAASPTVRRALAHLLAWKLSLHGRPTQGETTVSVDPSGASYSRYPARTPVTLRRISGHRDADSTSCPGDVLYRQLGALRQQASALVGQVAVISASAPAVAVLPAPVAVAGRLALSSGAALPGAAVEIWRRGATEPLAVGTSAADGSFALAVLLPANAELRAAATGVPAAISEAFAAHVAPALTLAGPPGPVPAGVPVTVTGTVAPAQPTVAVVLVSVTANGTVTSVQDVHAAGSTGTFSASLTPPGPGEYLVSAQTAASAHFAAGQSPPLRLAAG